MIQTEVPGSFYSAHDEKLVGKREEGEEEEQNRGGAGEGGEDIV